MKQAVLNDVGVLHDSYGLCLHGSIHENILTKNKKANRPIIPFECAYELNIISDTLEWYGGFHNQLGYKQHETPLSSEKWEKIIHPEDRTAVRKEMQRSMKFENIYMLHYRIVTKNGGTVRVTDSGTILRNSSGTPYKCVGIKKFLY